MSATDKELSAVFGVGVIVAAFVFPLVYVLPVAALGAGYIYLAETGAFVGSR